ncbi:MAG: acyltransferase [Candidatus Symbiothrix sp.]|nr:acyltransferase [Candidatus Symbiothrix sp.]
MKPHYEILDGLRGVAAIAVLGYHVLEAYSIPACSDGSCYFPILNHAYLAVDFFFVLSGFVIGYAYDDRWATMSVGKFLKRRIIRLHPMVVFGTVLGAALFYFGASEMFPLIKDTPLWQMLVVAVLGMLMIPMPPSADIRGWQEMYTLDAPTWSLAYEYIANILYALIIRRFGKVMLSIFVALAACATIYLALTRGDIQGGWELSERHLYAGFTRVLYPFFAGLLLYRLGKTIHIRNAFVISVLLLIVVLIVPRVGDAQSVWKNGIYESAVILLIFPLIVAIGAGGTVKSERLSRLCKFLGDISYPMYLVNYPICYVHTAWISNTKHTLAETGWISALVFLLIFAMAWIAMKYFDIPVRKWLTKTKKFVPLHSK